MKVLNGLSDNLDVHRLGAACRAAADEPKCGDMIDRGLILLRELEKRGYGVIMLGSHRAAEPKNSAK